MTLISDKPNMMGTPKNIASSQPHRFWNKMSNTEKLCFIIYLLTDCDLLSKQQIFEEFYKVFPARDGSTPNLSGFKHFTPINMDNNNFPKIKQLSTNPILAITDGLMMNSLESILMLEATQQGIDPSTMQGSIPQTIKRLYPEKDNMSKSSFNKKHGKNIRGIFSGNDSVSPNIEFYDDGEGLAPNEFIPTLGSLNSTKTAKPWMSGIFGQGGKAILNFGFLVLTIFKKHPESSGYKQEEWGLTVQYLHQRPDMPYGVYVTLLDQNGDIPTFLADGLPILRTVHEDTMNPEMLEGNHEYSIMKSGLYKKIYGYDTGGINYKDFSRLLSERFSGLNYPIYFNDIRRKFESHTSFEHIYGTRERLANLDPDIFDYNSSKMFWIDGHPIHLDLWLFSKTKRGDKARGKDTSKRITNYFPSGGASILMEVNSQINHIDKDFFAYTLKGELQHIKKDLSIIIDFDSIKDQSLLFDIFLPDRVSINKKHPFMVELYKEIKRFLLSDHGLQLQNQKRQQQAIEDARTINDTDQKYWQDFHSRYFNPAKPNTSIQPENEIPLEKHPKLLDHPTEWRLKSNKNNLKQIPLNQNHIQVAFITNAKPDYFTSGRGIYKIEENGNDITDTNRTSEYSFLNSGIVHFKIDLPGDRIIGTRLSYRFEIHDYYDGRAHNEQGNKDNPFIFEFEYEITKPVSTYKQTSYGQRSGQQIEADNPDLNQVAPEIKWVDDASKFPFFTDEEAAHLDKRPHEVPVIYINSQNTEFSKLLQESKVNSRKDYFRKYWITQMAISALVSVTQDETKQKESVGWARQAYLSSKIAGLIPKEFSL